MSAPDYSEIEKIEKRMKQASLKMHKLAPMVAVAWTVKSYDKDRRKQKFGTAMVKYLKAGESAASAEAYALADADYGKEIDELQLELENAHKVLKEDEVEKTAWETARSLLARQRKTMDTLPETED